MVHDLRIILEGWEYEPGKISVRKIIGRDGREKIQTRVDLGVLQCETSGRPDGERPNGCESLLDYFEGQLRVKLADADEDTEVVLSSEACRELRHEAHLYYQRYLAMFVLGEFEGVVRDTDHNLRVIDLCEQYAEADYDREALESQRAYVSMMHIRAQAYAALAKERFEDALAMVDEGVDELQELTVDSDEAYGEEQPPEVRVLLALREEVIRKTPKDARVRLRWELEQALEREEYERAAEIRDRLDPSAAPTSKRSAARARHSDTRD